MVKDAQSHSEEDRKRREEIESRNRLDSLVYASEKTYNENKAKLSGADASTFEAALAEAKAALGAGGVQAMNDAAEKLQQASHKLAEAMYKGAPEPSAGPSSGAEPGAGAGKEDEVIDTEYVDSEKK